MLYDAAREALDRLLGVGTNATGDGLTMKALLLDNQTLEMMTVLFSQTQLLERGVFHVHTIATAAAATGAKIKFLKAVTWLRPTPESLRSLAAELSTVQRYPSYTLGFSHVVPTEGLHALAMADHSELVKDVVECFVDFVVINRELALAPLPARIPRLTNRDAEATRIASAVSSLCLTLRRRGRIRVQNTSADARKVAAELLGMFGSEPDVFDATSRVGGGEALILIVDRSIDPVAPLLTPWTYQSMLHEHIGVVANTVTLPGQKPEDVYVMSPFQDSFFSKNMFSNWGDLCVNVRNFVEEYRDAMQGTGTGKDRSTASLEDLRNAVANFGQNKLMSALAVKHVGAVTHLSDVVRSRKLFDISNLEQDMLADSNPADQMQRLTTLAADPAIERRDILRLCMIYAARYESKPGAAATTRTDELLVSSPPADRDTLVKYRDYCRVGLSQPFTSAALFQSTGVVSSVLSFMKGMPDVENMLTHHEPAIKTYLTQAINGKLSSEHFPFVSGPAPPAGWRPKDVILVMTCGATYDEAMFVSRFNNSATPANATVGAAAAAQAAAADAPQCYLCASEMLSSRSFMDLLKGGAN